MYTPITHAPDDMCGAVDLYFTTTIKPYRVTKLRCETSDLYQRKDSAAAALRHVELRLVGFRG
jgi:hypothetical protein